MKVVTTTNLKWNENVWIEKGKLYISVFFIQECDSGRYGKDCTKTCSKYCLHNKPCNHIDGACTDGCQDGYIGHNCITCKNFCKCNCLSIFVLYTVSFYWNFDLHYILACEHGRYGKNCSHTCSSNCKTCQHTDGTCSCNAGWGGPNCSIGIYLFLSCLRTNNDRYVCLWEIIFK